MDVSFDVKYEKLAADGSVVLFSEKPMKVLKGDYYKRRARVFPNGTKVAQRVDGELTQIYIVGETDVKAGTLPRRKYAGEAYELSLTDEMKADPLGVRLCSTNMGRGLMTMFVDSE